MYKKILNKKLQLRQKLISKLIKLDREISLLKASISKSNDTKAYIEIDGFLVELDI